MQNLIRKIQNKTFIAWLILIFGIICSFFISYDVLRSEKENTIKYFSFVTEQLTQKINEQLQAYALIIQGSGALFNASDEVTREDWHDYIQALHVNKILDASLGIGYNVFIPHENLSAHIQSVQNEGFKEYRVLPFGKRETYSPVVFIEPFAGENLKVFGFDTFSETRRRTAMEQARDTGKPTITENITLIQENNKVQFGMIMFQAVYHSNLPLESIEERRKAIKGWISLPFYISDLVKSILDNWYSQVEQNISLKIYDQSLGTINEIVYENNTNLSNNSVKTAFYKEHSLIFYNQHFLITFDNLLGFSSTVYLKSALDFILGVFISFLLFSLILSIIRTKQYAKRIAKNLTTKIEKSDYLLKQNEALLQNLIRAMPDLVWMKDKKGIFLTCNSRFENFFGKPKKFIVGKTDYDFFEKSIADEYRKNDLLAIHHNITHSNEEKVTFANDGHQEILMTTKTPIYDENNTLLGVLGIGHDITQRKQDEDMLRKLSIALEQSPASVVITDLDANVEYVNPRFTEITGYCLAEIIHQNPRILQSGKNNKDIYLDMWKHLINGKIWKGELLNKRKNGTLYWEEARISPIKNDKNEVTHYIALKIDITQRKEYEIQIKTLLEEQKAILNSHIVGIAKLRDRKFIWVNEEFAMMHGYTPEELIGQYTRILYPDEESYNAFGSYAYPLLVKGGIIRTQVQNRHKDGTLKWYKIGGGKLHFSVNSQESIWSFVDITEQKRIEEENTHLAFYDVLTKLPNRRLLDDRLAQALSKSTRTGLYGALLFLDLDNFKPLNDTHGHHGGDILLIEVANRLQQNTRDYDTVARFGGDEFVVVLNDLHVNYDDAKILAEKISAKISLSLAKPYHISIPSDTHKKTKVTHSCTASMGVVLFQDHKAQQEDILKWADNAMYKAKEKGKNKIVFAAT